ncbi:MAG: sugar ABC transporter ATP-binding protein [Alphaproteobacteria bacterium]
MSEYILEVKNVSKTFPGVKALSNVNLKIRTGSVHALMGENGAGKSTLMKILYGIYIADKGGELFLDGQPFKPTKPIDAIRSGLTMVPQEISPARNLSIAANFYLGREITKGGFLDNKDMNQEVSQTLNELGIPMDVTEVMDKVSVAKSQLIAIATAVSYDSKVIIMDEPTTALTEAEVQQLYDIIKKVKERGIAIIYISHKLDEIFETSDEVSVLRDGEYIGTKNIKDITKNELIEMMVGRSMTDMFKREEVPIGDVLLRVENLQKEGKFRDVTFDVHKGEIFGIAGLVGAGRSEIVEALFGYKPADSGEIYIDGKMVSIKSPNDAIANKIGFVTEDRKLTGLFLNLNITDNIIMPDISPYLRSFLISEGLIKEAANNQKKALRIKAPSVRVITDNLSGGNQQKVLLARWLLLEPDILILDEPTKGIDVGARAEIYKIMVELAKMGKAIIMISSDMLELLAMSDRIMVMAEGKETGIISKEQATQELVLKLAAGETLETALEAEEITS